MATCDFFSQNMANFVVFFSHKKGFFFTSSVAQNKKGRSQMTTLTMYYIGHFPQVLFLLNFVM
jgi:hypothetical protein